jgi:hypothetical protein
VDDNTVTMQLIGREIDGQPLPKSEPVSIVRLAVDGNSAVEGAAAEATSDAAPADAPRPAAVRQ